LIAFNQNNSKYNRGGKQSMNLYDFRRNPRRASTCRRRDDRRKINFPFGSPEWVRNIENHYLALPKTNRRHVNRRNEERRAPDRRQQQLSERLRSEIKYSPILLTQEERKLIEDLYNNDLK
jgi:hypothetical protein